MNEVVTIPEAAWEAACNVPDGDFELAVEAAAPHIDRAARIDELRNLAGEIGKRADNTRHNDQQFDESYVLETVHTRIAQRLLELLEGQGHG